MTENDAIDGYYVARTTTDKLAEMLNGFSSGWNVIQITHTGGRDWVIIATQEFEDYTARSAWMADEGI